MDAAGMRRRIDRLRQLVEGFQLEMQAVQSDHKNFNWQEYPQYLGALLKAQQACAEARITLLAAHDRLAGKKPQEL
jgi:hypothetical protein